MPFLPTKNQVCRFTCVLLLLIALLPSPGSAEQLSPQQQRGKEIYTQGRSSVVSGEITAFFGNDNIALPGTSAPCSGCHGHDGSGRPESGIIPYNITWAYLTKSYGHRHGNGLLHPPFNAEDLKSYLKTGQLPGGVGKSDPAMPRYEMSEQQLEDLIAYLKQLGNFSAVGVSNKQIRIGTLLPTGEPLHGIGRSIAGILKAAVDEINAGGGIYNRQLHLEVRYVDLTSPADLGAKIDELEAFALLSPFLPGAEEELSTAVNERQVPLVGPLTIYPETSFARNRQSFYLFPGIGEQIKAILLQITKEKGLARPRIAILAPGEGALSRTRSELGEWVRKQRWQEPLTANPAAPARAQVELLAGAGVDLVVFLGNEQQALDLLQQAVQQNWMPLLTGPGQLMGRALQLAPAEFAERLYLSYPTLPSDRSKSALQKLQRLLAANQLNTDHPQTIVSAYAAARLLVEGLRLSGRKLDHRRLIDQLEQLTYFPTGLIPPLSFTGNRHVGTGGTYLVWLQDGNPTHRWVLLPGQ